MLVSYAPNASGRTSPKPKYACSVISGKTELLGFDENALRAKGVEEVLSFSGGHPGRGTTPWELGRSAGEEVVPLRCTGLTMPRGVF